jgi:hypothetical protein
MSPDELSHSILAAYQAFWMAFSFVMNRRFDWH